MNSQQKNNGQSINIQSLNNGSISNNHQQDAPNQLSPQNMNQQANNYPMTHLIPAHQTISHFKQTAANSQKVVTLSLERPITHTNDLSNSIFHNVLIVLHSPQASETNSSINSLN